MLVLSRHPKESVKLHVPPCAGVRVIEVYISDVHGDKVRLAFDVPADVLVLRSELGEPRPGQVRLVLGDDEGVSRTAPTTVADQGHARKAAG